MSARRGDLRVVRGAYDPPQRVDPRPVAGVLPPHDLDAEAAVLSAMLLDPSCVARVLERLKPDDFYSEANARIFQAVQEVALAPNGAVDVVSVASWLSARGWLQKIGGAAYLAQIADATPSIANVLTHAKIITTKARRRRVIAHAQLVAAEGYGDVGDEDAWCEAAGPRIATASEVERNRGTTSLRDALKETFASIDRVKPGEITGYSTGLPTLDAITSGLQRGEVVLLKAKKKTGKSVICGQLVATIANRIVRAAELSEGERARLIAAGVRDFEHARRGGLILALEGKTSDWSTRLACSHARVDWHRVRTGHADDGDLMRLARASDRLSELPVEIDDRKDLTLAKLAIRVRATRDDMARRGVVLSTVVLDNIQLWDDPDDRRERRIALDSAMRGIMNLAAAPDLAEVAWIVVSQINADGQARDSGAALEAHADSIWWLSVDDDEEHDGAQAARVNVEAQRRGPPGKAPFWFYRKWTLFWDSEMTNGG